MDSRWVMKHHYGPSRSSLPRLSVKGLPRELTVPLLLLTTDSNSALSPFLSVRYTFQLDQWVFLWGRFFLPGDIRQCLETFLIVVTVGVDALGISG